MPALLLLLVGSLLPDSPSSLAERGRPEAAREVLQRVRGKRGAHSSALGTAAVGRTDATSGLQVTVAQYMASVQPHAVGTHSLPALRDGGQSRHACEAPEGSCHSMCAVQRD